MFDLRHEGDYEDFIEVEHADIEEDATVQAGEAATLPFDITDGWGEYKITFIRPSKNDDITVSNIAIYTRSSDETGIQSIYDNKGVHNSQDRSYNSQATMQDAVYALQGHKLATPTQKGIYIKNGKKYIVR